MLLCGTGSSSRREFSLPGPTALDLEYEGPAQERPDQHQPGEETQAREGKLDRDCLHDVCCDQHFQAE